MPKGPPRLEKKRRVLRATYLVIFAFAQLRAEVSENDAGEARRASEFIKNLNSGKHRKSHVLHLATVILIETVRSNIRSGKDF